MPFIQITDPHFTPKGEILYGLDPAARFAAVVDVINAEHANADFVLVTGDLADAGDRPAYESLRAELERLRPPALLMTGNHDSRAALRAVFPDLPDAAGFLQFEAEADGGSLICLDTLIDEPGEHGGELCETRLDWLSARLAALPEGRDWLLAMHHPPFDVGLPAMDGIRLREPEALWEIIAPRPPRMILLGHVHRPVHGVWRGVPWHIQRGVNHQVPYQPWRDDLPEFTDDASALSVVSLAAEGVVIHTRDVVAGTRFHGRN